MALVLWWWWFFLFHLLRSTTSQDDSFFLLLEKVEERNISNQTEQCRVGTRELNCLCGGDLKSSYVRYRNELMKTCTTYDVVRDDSPFSFCEEAFLALGYRIQTRSVWSVEDSSLNMTNGSTFSSSSNLTERIRSLEASLENFKRVLDRTIIGVLIEREEDRCSCFDNYKKWLCSGLPLYMFNSSNLTAEGDSNISSVFPVRPCLSVCYKVLQSCPYYLPSQFQANNEVIYGGYPAFDCPRAAKPDYDEGPLCIGESGDLSHKGVGVIMIISLTLFLLAVRSIT